MTVTEALGLAASRLASAGVTDAEQDAEVLLRHVLGWDRARVVVDGSSSLDAADEARFLALVDDRATRRPLQHLTGTQAFWRHDFRVGPEVLIPRPETEAVVEACIEELRGQRAPRIVDVGTGSGCIAVSLAIERPDAEVHAVDLSEAALRVARENARRLGAERVAFQRGDLLETVEGRFDLVVSNPPYVDASEVDGLEPEVRDHDPREALVPPEGDRYVLYPRLAHGAARVLHPSGALILEIGHGMDDQVRRILEDAGLRAERVVQDLQGIPRVLVARKPGYRSGALPE